MNFFDELKNYDEDVFAACDAELARQRANIELIASENIVSKGVLLAAGTVLTNKYAEGYPSKRYYGGCQCVDVVEEIARERAKKLFGAEHANVQPHCGASANLAVFFALLQPGDTVMGMNLQEGGHLSHGSPVNISGKYFNVVPYGVDPVTEMIDYDEMERIAKKCRPKLIVAGASAYSRIIDFKRCRQIADEVGAYLMVDMAHIGGLVAGGAHPSPVPYADVVTSTTHKTLRGPRGAIILCKQELAKKIDSGVFPRTQGGPLMHIIAAKAVCLKEASEPAFEAYAHQVVKNAAVLAETLQQGGVRLVSGGTDNHLMLMDVLSRGRNGAQVQDLLDAANITANKNAIPFDTLPVSQTSGVRLGTAAATTRGMGEEEMRRIGQLICRLIDEQEAAVPAVKEEVLALCEQFPLYPED